MTLRDSLVAVGLLLVWMMALTPLRAAGLVGLPSLLVGLAGLAAIGALMAAIIRRRSTPLRERIAVASAAAAHGAEIVPVTIAESTVPLTAANLKNKPVFAVVVADAAGFELSRTDGTVVAAVPWAEVTAVSHGVTGRVPHLSIATAEKDWRMTPVNTRFGAPLSLLGAREVAEGLEALRGA